MTQLQHLCKSIILQRVKSREPLWGGWRVTQFIGSGAFGCVFKIVKKAMGDRAESALKVIYLEKKFDRMAQRQTVGGGVEALKESLESQVKEILLLYELSGHSNVVTWHDHDVFYMKGKEGLIADIMVRMEYLPVSLGQLLAKDKIPWERALEILTHCLAGLEHIHSKGIIHRDIKPDKGCAHLKGSAMVLPVACWSGALLMRRWSWTLPCPRGCERRWWVRLPWTRSSGTEALQI